MVLDAVVGVDDRGNSSLGVRGVGLVERSFGYEQDAAILGSLKGGPQASDARTDDQDVGENLAESGGVKGDQIATKFGLMCHLI